MIVLQGLKRVLVRSSDNMETTRAKLEGVALDRGRVLSSSSTTRPATGVEVCECPAEYGSDSCQDPGPGHYRWYEQHYVATKVEVALAGSARRCLCNGRTEECHPETGKCLVGFFSGDVNGLRQVFFVSFFLELPRKYRW